MKTFVSKIVRFLAAEDGPTAVEYAMLMMFVFLVVLSAVNYLGQSTAENFDRSSTSIQDALDARP